MIHGAAVVVVVVSALEFSCILTGFGGFDEGYIFKGS